ncbi:hypothetical protein EYF80_032500 [Liparis tanakae]|uniref:Uncharacterized protein n=1 Tax=Liparis tanakae TaxID=230148 RepID=A0A4Z2GVE0_9TELE|nr:hypothetical protein EYF80_032500 [Liparis tanakae]
MKESHYRKVASANGCLCSDRENCPSKQELNIEHESKVCEFDYRVRCGVIIGTPFSPLLAVWLARIGVEQRKRHLADSAHRCARCSVLQRRLSFSTMDSIDYFTVGEAAFRPHRFVISPDREGGASTAETRPNDHQCHMGPQL